MNLSYIQFDLEEMYSMGFLESKLAFAIQKTCQLDKRTEVQSLGSVQQTPHNQTLISIQKEQDSELVKMERSRFFGI